MVAHGRVELLAHPLSQKYLQMKWHSYGKYFHLANLLFYCIFLIFVMVYTYLLMMNSEAAPPRKRFADCNLSDPTSADRINKTEHNIVFTPGNSHIQQNVFFFLIMPFKNVIKKEMLILNFITDFESRVAMYTSAVAILVYNCICLIREAYNVKQQKWHYMVDPSNLVSWTLYISSTLMVFPTLVPYFEEIKVASFLLKGVPTSHLQRKY